MALSHPFGGFRLSKQSLKPLLTTSNSLTSIGCFHCTADTDVQSTKLRKENSDRLAENKGSVTTSSTLLSIQWNQDCSARLQQKLGSIRREFHTGTIFQYPEKSHQSQDAGKSHVKESANVNPGNEEITINMEKEISENLQQVRKKEFEKIKMSHPEDLQHFRKDSQGSPPSSPVTEFPPPAEAVTGRVKELPIGVQTLPHPIWTEEEVNNIQITHKKPVGVIDTLAWWSVKLLRKSFDVLSGYNRKYRDEGVWVNRICFLETVAGVPGMVGAMVRHLDSLRKMRRDHAWIHTLLEEAENERMHLMTALQLKQPGVFFRMAVVGSQGCMVTFFSLAYMISPRYCHRFVGYLEEEAVITYTKCLQDIENGGLQHWKTQPAPYVAIVYWKLAADATMKDVILAIRADEAHHRVVNHTLGSMKKDDPYKPGE